MEAADFKELIRQVRCETTPGLGFTEEDLAQVKACVEQVQPIEVVEYQEPTLNIADSSCIPGATAELQKMLEAQQGQLIIGMQQGILRSKVQELRDNLDTVKKYYDTRYAFLSELIQLSATGGTGAVNQRIQNISSFPTSDEETKNQIKAAFAVISNQLLINFSNSPTPAIPIRTVTVDFRLIGLNGVTVKLSNPQTNVLEDTLVKVFESEYLTKNVFENKISFAFVNQDSYNPTDNGPLPKEESDYDTLPGLLYNGTPGIDYAGLYRKLSKPFTYLFTLEERGLTLNEGLIDPNLKKIQDAPTSMKEGEVTYYIQNQQTYETFYGNLEQEYPKRVKKENEQVYPVVCAGPLTTISFLAQTEVADVYRRNPSYGTTVVLKFYRDSKAEIDQLISDCDDQLKKLDALVKENTMDEETIKKKILAIPCFTKAGNIAPETDPLCEGEAKKHLGTDPLYLRTVNQLGGDFPDFTTQCYWKEFAKALNKICLLPYPDLSGPPPSNLLFRYWPVNCVIPAGPALVLLTVPPVWKPLFVLPTPLGTLVCFLTMPIAPIGIPLPSIYLFFLAPDGTKYLALAVNIPLLYTNTKNLVFGFELDTSSTSQNPLGLSPTNAYKGYPIKGAYLTPLKVSASTAKAARLANLAVSIASGEQPAVENLNGETLPFNISYEDYTNGYLSETEMMLGIVDAAPSKEFDRSVTQVKGQINKQIDKLGDMQTTAVDSLRQKLRTVREDGVTDAEKEKDLATKRMAKRTAREINPITIDEKISSVTDSFNAYIDNIKFGTIRFPKDATKNNPGLPEVLTALFDLITLGSVGDLKIDDSAKSLNSQIKKALAKINVEALTAKTEFDLDVAEDVAELKSTLTKMVDKCIAYLKGEPVDFDLSSAKTKEEETEILKSNRAIQEMARDALAFTAVALANPPRITLFDLSKKCCEVTSTPVFSGVPPLVSMAFAVLSALMQAIIDGLSIESIVGFIGTSSRKIGISFVTTLFDGLVSAIPNVTLPDPANLLLLIQSFLVPILSMLSIPKAFNPLQPPLFSIVIPLDPILKPLIKLLVSALIAAIFKLMDEANTAYVKSLSGTTGGTQGLSGLKGTSDVFGVSNSDNETLKQIFSMACGFGTTVSVSVSQSDVTQITTTIGQDGELIKTANPIFNTTITTADGTIFVLPALPFLALDITGYFHLLTGNDIIEFVRQLINSIFDMIIAPLKTAVDLISKLAVSLNTYSYNIIEAAIPLISIIKLAKMAIDAAIPPSVKLRVISPDMINLMQLSIIPALEVVEPVLKEIAWIGTTALCALSSPVTMWKTVSIARMIHPIMNSDDLPPWERLTHKNPLFAIFLDEIAWRGSIYSTGSLIFQTKTPVVLPYTPTFPIVHISPHLT